MFRTFGGGLKKQRERAGSDKAGARSAAAAGASGTPTRRGRPSTQQSEAITRVILDAAAALFLRDGFEATGMEAVAASARIPKTTLYKRYADKRELLSAVLVDRVASWSRVSSRKNKELGDDLGARLKSRTATMLLWATKPEVRAVTRLAASLPGHSDGRVRPRTFFGYERMSVIIENDIRQFGPGSGIRAAAPQKIADALMALIWGWLDLRESDKQMTGREAMQQADFMIDLLLQGHRAW